MIINSYGLEVNLQEENNVYNNCLFIFDTSALLNLYFYSEKTQSAILENILKKLSTRDLLWIPNWVYYEFSKHRKEKIKVPLNFYDSLIEMDVRNKDSGHLNTISTMIKKVRGQLDAIRVKTEKEDKHPVVELTSLINFENKLQEFESQFKTFKERFSQDVLTSKNKLIISTEEDQINDFLLNNFKIGSAFSFSELISICKNGKWRFEFQIPPGYKDSKEKIGISQYGDLIIWQEILNYAKLRGKSVVFICNDTKEDWCIRRDKNNIIHPRQELIKEFYDFTKNHFLMCTLSQFLYKIDEHLQLKVEKEIIEEVEKTFDPSSYENEIDNVIQEFLFNLYPKSTIIKTYELTNKKKLDYVLDFYDFKIGVEVNTVVVHSISYYKNKLNKGIEYIKTGQIDSYSLIVILNQTNNSGAILSQLQSLEKSHKNTKCRIYLGYIKNSTFNPITIEL